MINQISTPTLLIDKQKVIHNISRMVGKAQKNGMTLRPHFKTHQSHEVGRWFKSFGVDKIAVSSIRMAQYFAKDGWQDITIAFPLNIREIPRLMSIPSNIRINILVENTEVIKALKQYHSKRSFGVFIKIDSGYHRTGLQLSQTDKVSQIIRAIEELKELSFEGFLAHAGHSYQKRSFEALKEVHESTLLVMQKFRQQYQKDFPNLTISIGDTPTCSVIEQFDSIEEIRPGNFVFYDLSQWTIGSCNLKDIAVVMACPVVAKHEDRSEIVVYGGGVHFSKDRMLDDNGQTYYGLVVPFRNSTWEINPFYGTMKSLSQEHGIVQASPALMSEAKIGDLIYVLPIHSCMTADLMKHYYTLEGHYISMMRYY